MKTVALLGTLLITSTSFGQGENAFNFESPARYTSDDLRDRARSRSFDSREQYEAVVGARMSMKNAYLNLLPHLSVGSAITTATYSGGLGILATVGDLVPFLLPTRWFRARESRHLYAAQVYASEIKRLNAMQITEGMSAAVSRDVSLIQDLKRDLEYIGRVEEEVRSLETESKLPAGSSLGFVSVHNSIEQAVSTLESNVAIGLTDLSLAAGFVNPGAISEVVLKPSGDLIRPEMLRLVEVQARAVKEVPEIDQIDELLSAAYYQRKARLFQWLDPSGDSQAGLGFGFGAYLQIGKSNYQQVEILREKVIASLIKKATDAFNNYAGWIDSYRLATQGASVQEERIRLGLQRARGTVAPYSFDFALAELRDSLAQLALNHVNQANAKFAWYSTLSQLDRILLRNAYQRAQP